MDSEHYIPQILYRFWSELVRDTADWALRTPNLLPQLAGMVCLRRVLQKTIEIDELLTALSIDASVTPRLSEEKNKILAEMAEARTPGVFFSSIPLFWAPVMQSAADEWTKANTSPAKAFEDFAQIAIDPEEVDRMITILCPDEPTRAECFRWAGHLVDVFSEAGGFSPPSAAADASADEEDYHWSGDLPKLDEKYVQWIEKGNKDMEDIQHEQQSTVSHALLTILTLYNSWRAIEAHPHRKPILRTLLAHLDEGIDVLEQTYSGDAQQLPLTLNGDWFMSQAALTLEARLKTLGFGE